MSIGDVLNLLKDEFPDVTISKIRFLESQGLLDPERTPSGYRKFYDADVERLRWILRQQKEHFLPLKVIKGRLDPAARAEGGPAQAGAAANGGAPDGHAPGPARGAPAVLAEEAPAAGAPSPAVTSSPAEAASVAGPEPAAETAAPGPDTASVAGPEPAAETAAPGPDTAPASAPAPARPTEEEQAPAVTPAAPARSATPVLSVGATGVSLTFEELVEASGLEESAVRDLERFGLVAGRPVARTVYYDEESLVVARLAAEFRRFGVEARHLRMYKTAAEREAGFFEQIVTPLLKQRNPRSRGEAIQTARDLTELGGRLRDAMLRLALRDLTGG